MKTIIPATGLVSKASGKQAFESDTAYRFNKHCMLLQCEEGTLLYHTLSDMLVLLENGEGVEDCKEALVNQWFLVPEHFDECSYANQIKKIAKLLVSRKKSHVTHFTILTTTDCNARCFYCYEMGMKRIPMSAETARDVAEYTSRVCGGESVKFRWFGGEPLYNMQAIDVICNHHRAKGIDYESQMTTNGYYLTPEVSRKAVNDWHLNQVQITLDGTEKIYNRTKAYIDADKNPYLRVLNNIDAALDAGINVMVRMNMDARNAEDLSLLIDILIERYEDKKGFIAYVAPLLEFVGSIHTFDSDAQAVDTYLKLVDKLRKHGMLRKSNLTRGIALNHCMADNDICEVILPDGRTGRCQHFREEIITGDVYHTDRDASVVNAWKERLVISECAECVLYPTCSRLKMCEWYKEGCTDMIRQIWIDGVKHQIMGAYRRVKEGGTIDETETKLYTDGAW